VDGYKVPDIFKLKTDVFRDRAQYAVDARKKLAEARRVGEAAIEGKNPEAAFKAIRDAAISLG
jgi:hypothetical protein